MPTVFIKQCNDTIEYTVNLLGDFDKLYEEERNLFEQIKKIISKGNELAAENCVVLSCLNAPELDTNFIKNIFSEFAKDFVFERRLENLSTFPAIDDEKALKNLIFVKGKVALN